MDLKNYWNSLKLQKCICTVIVAHKTICLDKRHEKDQWNVIFGERCKMFGLKELLASVKIVLVSGEEQEQGFS